MPVPIVPHAGLLTDLYELTMSAAYWKTGKSDEVATFELSVRSIPAQRSFLLAAGLEQAVEYLQQLRFSGEEIDFLRKHSSFESVPTGFFDFLGKLRFTGSVWAVPEGSLMFAEEPLLRITAPIVQAQIAETYLMAMLTYQTSVATKAARVVEAAGGRGIVEFGTRRAHGPVAGLLAARASYVGGCLGTSNTLAGFELGIPTYGTTAHSWTMSFEDEEESFRRFAELFGSKAVLLVDTYDSIEGVKKALQLGLPFRGVRLDSGNFLEISRQVRKLLNDAGRTDALILASGDLNEYVIRTLAGQAAPIDLFGVGTDLVTSRDAPALSGIYKIVEIESHGKVRYTAKFSESKVSYPGKKQVFRYSGADGFYSHDVLGLADESFAGAEPLLEPVIEDGNLVRPLPALAEIRERTMASMARLPEAFRRLQDSDAYPVNKSLALERLLESVRVRYAPLPAAAGEPR
ncbi:MAG: nicotinate phosphoribosyltransferase [Acidobacteria bacterium]|nr:nicotinate phosphoribosyltransferase [Acidobacteriota bacterium]